MYDRQQVFEDDVSIASDGVPPVIDDNEQLSPVVEEKSVEYNSLDAETNIRTNKNGMYNVEFQMLLIHVI